MWQLFSMTEFLLHILYQMKMYFVDFCFINFSAFQYLSVHLSTVSDSGKSLSLGLIDFASR